MAVRTLVRPVATTGLALGLVALTAGVAEAAPVADYQMPFSCTQEWSGSTRSYHSPSANSVDFNRPDDLGQPVLAAESGVVTSATDLGNRSYGKYIKVAHGNDESTLYAHLQAMFVGAGQRVDQGQVIGALGTSGGSTGPHLHFEERRGSSVVVPYFDGVAYRMPQTSRSRNCVKVPVAGDWNNSGTANLGVFERRWKGFFRQKLGKTVVSSRLGRGLDTPLVGDWDADGKTDIGVRRTMDGVFVLPRSGGGVDSSIRLGGPAATGVAGDWDGNGATEVGIWRPWRSDFRIRLANGRLHSVALGSAASLPVTGDFNGDGRTDVGVYDAPTATWSMRRRTATGWSSVTTLVAGMRYELPVTGDWNGDGTTDLATWNRDTGAWTRRTTVDGTARTSVKYFGAP